MGDLVKDTLEGTQKALRKEKAAGNTAMIDDAVSKMSENERAKVRPKAWGSRGCSGSRGCWGFRGCFHPRKFRYFYSPWIPSHPFLGVVCLSAHPTPIPASPIDPTFICLLTNDARNKRGLESRTRSYSAGHL